MSIAGEVMKLIFAVLGVSFNCGHYRVIVKRQLLYVNYGRGLISDLCHICETGGSGSSPTKHLT